MEIVVVDDGSHDETEQVVRELSEGNSEVILCRNDRTKGPSGARNTGILKASGQYIAFLDSDDEWLENHLSDGMRFLDGHPEIDVLFGNFEVVEHETNRHLFTWFDQKRTLLSLDALEIEEGFHSIQDNLFIALVKESSFHVSSAIIRQDVCKNTLFNESSCSSEDRDFAIRLDRRSGAAFAYRDEPTHIYYRHPTSLTGGNGLEDSKILLKDTMYLYNGYLDEFELSKGERHTIRSLLSEDYLDLSYVQRKQSDFRAAVGSTVSSARNRLGVGCVIELAKIAGEWVLSRRNLAKNQDCVRR